LLPKDLSDILHEFSAAEVEYLLVGGYALAAHGLPRATGDIDLWIRCGSENAARVIAALRRFGAPMDQVAEGDFLQPGIVSQIGLPPCRVDVLTEIEGVTFEEAWPARRHLRINGHTVPVISREHLVRNKQRAGRPQDLADVAALLRRPPD
jgi:hypothetical protein